MILRLEPTPAGIVGYLFGCAHLTNTRSLTLLGDADADAYEILFSFASPAEKRQFLDLIRANEDLGNGMLARSKQSSLRMFFNAECSAKDYTFLQ